MIKTLHSPETSGCIKAINSKSEAHRVLICAALSDKKTEIRCESINEDITATADCLKALGAGISFSDGAFTVEPIKNPEKAAVLPCNESGSTLRFLLPLVSAFGGEYEFHTNGRLSQRPLSPLKEELQKGGTVISVRDNRICVSGCCNSDEFTIEGNISSQFISGLMLMLSLTGGKITVTGSIESRPYIAMTADALKEFGCNISFIDNVITVPKTRPLISPEKTEINGDWSNAAFFITAGVIGKKAITVTGLDFNSRQGDKAIITVLRKLGAKIEVTENSVTAFPSSLHGTEINAKDIPDLVPVLSVAAANAEGETRITACARLRLKESDRIETVKEMIIALGGKISVENDSLIINGFPLTGGSVDSKNDHRIAMSAAVAAFSAKNAVTVINAEAVNKSYPRFWDEIKEG